MFMYITQLAEIVLIINITYQRWGVLYNMKQWSYISSTVYEQDCQYTLNVTVRRVRTTTVAVEKE